jgi:hypothetical protein
VRASSNLPDQTKPVKVPSVALLAATT